MRLLITILLVAAVTPVPIHAGGVTGFDLAPNARFAAMGMTGVAEGNDPAGVLFNPAAAAAHRGVAINSAYANWSGDVDHFVNAFAWAGPAGPVTLGGALAHTRLDFKTFAPDFGYLPFNTQASFITATAASRWAGHHGSLSVGTSLVWDTSEDPGSKTLFDIGVRATGPAWQRAGWTVRYALALSALRRGGGAAARGDYAFARGAGGGRIRYGASLAIEARALAVRVNADAIEFEEDGGTTATAAGIELSFFDTLHARAGYGDGIVAGRNAVTLGAGAGRGIGDVELRFDYARVESSDNELAANVFGARIALDF